METADNTLRRSAAANLNMIGAEIQLTAAASGVVPDDTFTVTQAVNSIGFGRFQIILGFIVGLCWMADSMEMMILSILPLALQCEWGINHYRQAFLTTIVFIGRIKTDKKDGMHKAFTSAQYLEFVAVAFQNYLTV